MIVYRVHEMNWGGGAFYPQPKYREFFTMESALDYVQGQVAPGWSLTILERYADVWEASIASFSTAGKEYPSSVRVWRIYRETI